MGHKVHPNGFRLGVIRGWHGKWYAEQKDYTRLLHEDVLIRRTIQERLADAGVPKIEIERNPNQVSVTIHAAKPGIVIGRGGAKVEELKQLLERSTGKRVKISISEIRQPELDAFLVAKNIAEQLERRVSYKRAVKQAANRSIQRGAKGIKIIASGRLGGAEMSRRETERSGRVPLHTLRADIDYGLCEAHTTFGRIGVKVWIYRGDILPEPKRVQESLAVREIRAEAAAAEAAAEAAAAEPTTPEEANEVMAAAIAQAEAAAAQVEEARVRAQEAQAPAPTDTPAPATVAAQHLPPPPAPVEAASAGLSAEERLRLAEAEVAAAEARLALLMAQAEAERARAEAAAAMAALREQQQRQQQSPPPAGTENTEGDS